MKKYVALFSGQGAQKAGMGKTLADGSRAARAVLDEAEKSTKAGGFLDFDLADLMFAGDADELERTSRCQPALFTHGMMSLAAAREYAETEGFDFELVGFAGLSLGEFTAYCAAGSINFAAALKLVARRGQFMEEETRKNPGSMAAMIGGKQADVEKLAKICGAECANYNAPGQIVITGENSAIDRALDIYKDYGVKLAKKLAVSGAYHSRLLMPARRCLEQELAETPITMPRKTVIGNYRADEAKSVEEIRETLAQQLTGSVRWTQSMQKFLDAGERNFIEFGCGGVLAGLMKRIERSAKVISLQEYSDMDKLGKDLAETT